MLRLNLRSKVLAGTLLVMLPMLALIMYQNDLAYSEWSDKILDDQLLTAQAVSAVVDASIDDSFAVAWSLSGDSVLQTMDPAQAGPRLTNLRQSLPQFDNIVLVGLNGDTIGMMSSKLPPGTPLPNGADRPHIQRVISTWSPAISNVMIARGTGSPTLSTAVPLLDETGHLKGIVGVALDLDYLARSLQVVRFSNSQAIFLTSPDGMLALHTLLPQREWGQRNLSSFPPVHSALDGVPALERNMEGLLGDMRMISTVRTEKYGWVVGVSIPVAEALQPIRDSLTRQLLLFAGSLLLIIAGALVAAHYVLFRPLNVLTKTLISFGRGQLDARAHLSTGDEFQKLGAGFDWMAEEIGRRERQRDAHVAQLKEAEGRLQTLASIVEYSDDLVIRCSEDGTITHWNPAGERICGYTAEEVVGKPVFLLALPDHLDEKVRIVERIGRGQQLQHYETVWVRKDGGLIDVSVTVSPIGDLHGETVGISIIARDVTEHKQVEKSFRVLAESSPIGTYIVEQGKFLFVNTRFQEYTGYTREELLGTESLRLVLPQDREMVKANAVQMLKGQRRTPYEYRIVNRSGSERWILETVASIHYEGKRTVVGSFMDITERREMEQQLAHLATHDPLTGLHNRRSLDEGLDRVVARARRGVNSSLLFLDLDDFKYINDALGHAAGDRALVMVANLLQEQLRPGDLLVRLGGDEFAILLENVSPSDAKSIAERTCRVVNEFVFILDHRTFRLGASVGVADITGEHIPSMLLAHADVAMYDAKAQGGSRVVHYEREAHDALRQ